MLTFKDFLIESADSVDSEEEQTTGFNNATVKTSTKVALDMMMKASSKSAGVYSNMTNIYLLESLSVIKEVLVSRLLPFLEDPKYVEKRKDKDFEELLGNIRKEIKEVLTLVFPTAKGAMNSVINLVVDPILAEIKRVSPAVAIKAFNVDKFDMSAKDVFGYMMRHVINSDIEVTSDDADKAEGDMMKWNKDVVAKRRSIRAPLNKAQRLAAIARSVEK